MTCAKSSVDLSKYNINKPKRDNMNNVIHRSEENLLTRASVYQIKLQNTLLGYIIHIFHIL